VTLKATLAEGEDVGEATRTLQTMAESLVEAHQQFMAKAIEDAYARERAEE
jgi:phage tail sheath protein FI